MLDRRDDDSGWQLNFRRCHGFHCLPRLARCVSSKINWFLMLPTCIASTKFLHSISVLDPMCVNSCRLSLLRLMHPLRWFAELCVCFEIRGWVDGFRPQTVPHMVCESVLILISEEQWTRCLLVIIDAATALIPTLSANGLV